MSYLCYLGKPWKSGARGPDAYDCWGLVMDFYKRHLGIQLKDLPTQNINTKQAYKAATSPENAADWIKQSLPSNKCLALMGQGKFLNHVGIYLDEGAILHSSRGAKLVIVESMRSIRQEYDNIIFYTHKHG